MGKKKTVIIDDSLPAAEKVERKKINPNPEMEEKVARKKINPNPETEEKKKVNPNPEVEQLKSNVIARETKQSSSEEIAASTSSSHDDDEEKIKKEVVTPKQGKKYRSKKYVEAQEKVERNRLYDLEQAVNLAKEVSFSKFGGSLELHMGTQVKNIRGLINLPFMSGKSLRIIAFGKGAADSGAEIIGDETALAEIEKGKANFDVVITTPDWMPRLARAAKVLGPRGLMPNPKNGTITDDLKKAVAEIQGGKTEYKTEKDRTVMHLAIGKANQETEEIAQNIKLLISTIGKTKIKKATIAPTMGPGVKIDINSI